MIIRQNIWIQTEKRHESPKTYINEEIIKKVEEINQSQSTEKIQKKLAKI